ncbi:helix-turn-helix domain-containing protein [Variovorax sp. J31P207]|uniref:winged helix-turn-helix transcriptional regulator n=1 Tax=Variovorax sp. J31P207 TaxID=3053510 RepID=UPI0025752C04|nr:helix-turn-helix domain-containing protein [Variovorax sp. J31P207]MDM0071487.1 helix-turn-helix domain-containing protein [Variovorax sp. J31P207]
MAPSTALKPTKRPARHAQRATSRVRASPTERNCSVGRTIDVIGDGWSFMVLRECYFGVKRFEQFKDILGLPRTTLSDRLRKLTAMGLLRQVQYTDKPPRFEYHLTRVGIDLYPVMLALMSFGDKWLGGRKKKPLQLIHRTCEHPCSAIVVCSECRVEILPSRVSYRDGPGAGTSTIRVERKSRRSADPTALERRRPSSVARALQVIGDRWSFMIIREAFFRVRRFDDLQSGLGIAPNILTDRLNRLVADGVFRRVQYQIGPDRYEYRFTEKGRDLFGSMIAMLHWGDRWLSGGKPPLILTHLDCGKDFDPTVACDQCREAINAHSMRYAMNYQDPKPPE